MMGAMRDPPKCRSLVVLLVLVCASNTCAAAWEGASGVSPRHGNGRDGRKPGFRWRQLGFLPEADALPSRLDSAENELANFLVEDIRARIPDNSPFSVLEIESPDSPGSAAIAHLFPEATWVVTGAPEDSLTPPSANTAQVDALSPEKVRSIYRSPQIFEYLTIPGFSSDFMGGDEEAVNQLGLLLGLARVTVIRVAPDSELPAFTKSSIQKAGQALVSAAEQLGHGVLVKNVQGNILIVEVTSLMRPVQHHYDDRRAASEGGTCFKYKLFHKTTAGVRGTPWLCQVQANSDFKGPGAPQNVEECPVDPQCGDRTIDLTNSSWINLKLLAGLGLSARDKERITRMYLELPEFQDCPTWNACLSGSRVVWCDSDAKGLQATGLMSQFVNKGCSRLDVGMKYDANPSCCLDLVAAAIDEHHCGMQEEEAQSLNIGHAFELHKAKQCRKKYYTSTFVPMQFHDSFVDDAQESFVFGSGREPSRMTKEELEAELKERGLPITVAKESSKNGLGNAKEQLIQRLEAARLDTSTMSVGELTTELQRLYLSTEGSQEELAQRLSRVRDLAYKRVKSKLFKGRIRNRIEVLRKSVEHLSKDELKDYLIQAGASTSGDKKELVARLKSTWKKSPEHKMKAIEELEKQLQYGDALYDVKMAEAEDKAKQRMQLPDLRKSAPFMDDFGGGILPMQKWQPAVWDAGSVADLGQDTGLGAPSVKSMSKSELQEEAKAAGLPTSGNKETLQKLVERARRSGKSPMGKGQAHMPNQQQPQGGPQGGLPFRNFGNPGSYSMGGYTATAGRVNMLANQLMAAASYDSDEHSNPDRMSRQALIASLEEKGVTTHSGMNKEKLIELAKKNGVRKTSSGEGLSSIKKFMERGFSGMPQPGAGIMASPYYSQAQGPVPSLRERLLSREATLAGSSSAPWDQQQWGAAQGQRPQRSSTAERVATGKLVVHMTKVSIEEALRAEGIVAEGTKEQLLDRLVTKMTKEEMVEQLKMMGLDTSGRKLDLKRRIIANKPAPSKG
mmetsp:Transcript_22632/g.62819  ORF Transcript_22632/g.62819 Transcript_22632/m.62819 type:complete len:1017 (+) Transcript_22632:224-3274(+)|eukprot:CAMPEP_0117661986 /NCGR_PEP_ID=MMETSP0804-20121206/7822_1 /TAXON_ID=1074897 /ORGANISM="Tetraselmis astigmatica, Strain CCMP880" /LENGTH=1016 /DNA_ID=CAMNT_0005468875 /DNA_START=199 /DNA_END=3249 /DNA_ORIENTATION=-